MISQIKVAGLADPWVPIWNLVFWWLFYLVGLVIWCFVWDGFGLSIFLWSYLFRDTIDVMWKPFCVWLAFRYICSIRSVLAVRNGISGFWYTFLYDFLIYLVYYVNGKFVCDVLFLLIMYGLVSWLLVLFLIWKSLIFPY